MTPEQEQDLYMRYTIHVLGYTDIRVQGYSGWMVGDKLAFPDIRSGLQRIEREGRGYDYVRELAKQVGLTAAPEHLLVNDIFRLQCATEAEQAAAMMKALGVDTKGQGG